MRILAHRGASGYAPENTLVAFDLACDMGAAWLETDVRLTRDGVAVLFHDQTIDRTTNGSGDLARLDWEHLAQLDAGGWFAPRFAGERVPRLDAFLERYRHRANLCLEIKCVAVIAPLLAALDSSVRDGAGEGTTDAAGAMEFTSFEWDVLMGLREALAQDAAVPLGYLVRRADAHADSIRRAADAGLAMFCPPADLVTPVMVAQAHAVGLRVRTWGVRTPADLAHVARCGVDGTTLNWPDWRLPTHEHDTTMPSKATSMP